MENRNYVVAISSDYNFYPQIYTIRTFSMEVAIMYAIRICRKANLGKEFSDTEVIDKCFDEINDSDDELFNYYFEKSGVKITIRQIKKFSTEGEV